MTSIEGVAVAVPPVAGAGIALANASASESPAGYIIAAVVGLIAVPMVRWLMKREDKRQAFEQAQSRRRDRLLAVQASRLRHLVDEYNRTNELLRDIAEKLGRLPADIAKKCNGG